MTNSSNVLTFGTPLSEFLEEFKTADREAFLSQQNGIPLLLLTTVDEESSDNLVNFETQNLPEQIDTRDLEVRDLIERVNDVLPNVRILKICKRNNEFKNIVTLGRAPKSDVLVNMPSISKFHCYFTHNGRDNTWYISDANAQNGTFLNGQRLKTNVKAKLSNGAPIRLGMSLSAHFFEPDGFFTYMKTLYKALQANSTDN